MINTKNLRRLVHDHSHVKSAVFQDPHTVVKLATGYVYIDGNTNEKTFESIDLAVSQSQPANVKKISKKN